MIRQFRSVLVLLFILCGCARWINGLSCYYCYLSNGCSDPINYNSGNVYYSTCYSNATACSKIVTTGGSTARGCSTSCRPTSDSTGSVYCCYTDYCNSSSHYGAVFPVVLMFAVVTMSLKTWMTT